MLSTVIIAAALIGGAEGKDAPKANPKGAQFFSGSYDDALAQAKARKVPLFMDLYAVWCGPCKMLDKQVFSDAAVGAFMNARLVAIKVNAEEGEGPDLQERFKVDGYPTGLIIDSATGKEIDRIVGFAPPKEYLKGLQEILEGGALADLEKKAKAAPNDLDAWFLYAKKLEDKRRKEAKEAWKKVAGLDPKDEKGKGSLAALGLARISAMETQDPKPLVEVAARYDGKPAALEAHRMIAGMLSQGGPVEGDDEKQLIASFEYILSHGGRDAETLNNYAWILASSRKDPGKGLTLAQEALKERPDAYHILDTAAECLFALGRKAEAVEMEKKAIAAAEKGDKTSVPMLKRRLQEFEKDEKKK